MSIEAMKKALEALKDANALFNVEASSAAYKEAVTALRQAIKEAALEGLSQTSREIEDIPCKDHPDAPHGFMRDESHSSGRYVCECEAWEPDDMSIKPENIDTKTEHVDGVDIDLLHQSEQEGWRWAKECEAEVKRLNKEQLDAIDRAYFAGKQAGIAEAVKREWQGLTDEEIRLMCHNDDPDDWNDIQQKLYWREAYMHGAEAAQNELRERNS
jgi:hypothetical protein